MPGYSFEKFLSNFCVNSVLMLETEINLNLISRRVNQAYVGTACNPLPKEFCREGVV